MLPLIMSLLLILGWSVFATVTTGSGFLPACQDLSIAELQGAGTASPYAGQSGLSCVSGCVTAVAADGFFIQSLVPDRDEGTSEAIFVYRWSGWTNPRGLRRGDLVEIRDFKVIEFYGSTEISGLHEGRNGDSYRRLGTCQLPPPVSITMIAGPSDPAPLYERYEGMRVSMEIDGTVAGPTTRYPSRFATGEPEIALLASRELRPAGEAEMGRRTPSPGSSTAGEGETFTPPHIFAREGLTVSLTYLSGAADSDLPDVAAGDRLRGEVVGVLAYRFENYTLLVDPGTVEGIEVTRARRRRVEPFPAFEQSFSLCTFNIENFFDAQDDLDGDVGDWSPATQTDYDALSAGRAAAIRTHLQGCDVIALQELEGKDEVWAGLAAAIGPEMGYDYYESVDPRDITVGILYDRDRVRLVAGDSAQTCTAVDYGVDYAAMQGPRGRPNPCSPGSYPLFTRPPYVAELQVNVGAARQPLKLTLVTVHLKSKRDEEQGSGELRLLQAKHLPGLLTAPHGVILGDFNDDLGSPAVQQFAGLVNLFDVAVPPESRYTYIYKGRAEAVDHVVMTPDLAAHLLGGGPLHVNADSPDTLAAASGRSSDHDPVLAVFAHGPAPLTTATAGALGGSAGGIGLAAGSR